VTCRRVLIRYAALSALRMFSELAPHYEQASDKKTLFLG
jgi:hypothetical protein